MATTSDAAACKSGALVRRLALRHQRTGPGGDVASTMAGMLGLFMALSCSNIGQSATPGRVVVERLAAASAERAAPQEKSRAWKARLEHRLHCAR
jgi:hypothetical protein